MADVVHTTDWKPSDFVTMHLMGAELGFEPRHLLCVMYSESGARASTRNHAGAHAIGLIQFMDTTLPGLGWTRPWEEFGLLSTTQQLPFVRRFLAPHQGHLKSVGQMYTAIFLPAFTKRADDPNYVLVDGARSAWDKLVLSSNAAFDDNHDMQIQVRELDDAVRRNCVGPRWTELVQRLDGRPDDMPEPVAFDLGTVYGQQCALNRLGYECEADGMMGPVTHGRIMAFQFDHPPLERDGVCGPRTQTCIREALSKVGDTIPG